VEPLLAAGLDGHGQADHPSGSGGQLGDADAVLSSIGMPGWTAAGSWPAASSSAWQISILSALIRAAWSGVGGAVSP
jgi:hypothetical protein